MERAIRLRMKLGRNRGVTLIETLAALFVATGCIAIVGASMPIATASRARADLSNRAVSLAQKELESIRSVGYPNLTPAALYSRGYLDSASSVATNTYSFTNADSSQTDSPAQMLPSGTGRVLLEDVDVELRRITVTVSWVDRGKTKTYQIGTLVANL